MKKIAIFISIVSLLTFSSFANEYTQDDVEYILNKAEQEYSIGNFESAYYYYRRLHEIKPNSFYILGRLGIISQEHHNDLKTAMEFYTKAINLQENAIKSGLTQPKSEYYARRGLTRFKLSDYNGAILDLTKAISIDKKYNTQYPEVYYFRASANLAQDNYQEAINDTTQAIKLKNKYPDAFYIRGLSKLYLYKNQNSITGIKSAMQDLQYSKEQFLQMNDLKGYDKALDTYNLAERILKEINY